MKWIVFSYSLPSKGSSSPRVTLWRRLRRLGAVAPAGGMHILPQRDECLEAFQWLAQEIRQAQGEAVVFRYSHCTSWIIPPSPSFEPYARFRADLAPDLSPIQADPGGERAQSIAWRPLCS